MNRLKELRKTKGVTQQTVADFLGITREGYSFYENGHRSPDYETLSKIAGYFGVTTDYLIGTDDMPYRENKYKRGPVLGNIPAGTPIEAVEDVIGYFDLPKDAYPRETVFGLIVDGDSMSPYFLSGDLVIFKKSCVAKTGDDVAVRINGGEVTLKRFRKLDNGIMLQPLNPIYAPMFFTAEEVETLPVEVVGVVLELRRVHGSTNGKRNGNGRKPSL